MRSCIMNIIDVPAFMYNEHHNVHGFMYNEHPNVHAFVYNEHHQRACVDV